MQEAINERCNIPKVKSSEFRARRCPPSYPEPLKFSGAPVDIRTQQPVKSGFPRSSTNSFHRPEHPLCRAGGCKDSFSSPPSCLQRCPPIGQARPVPSFSRPVTSRHPHRYSRHQQFGISLHYRPRRPSAQAHAHERYAPHHWSDLPLPVRYRPPDLRLTALAVVRNRTAST